MNEERNQTHPTSVVLEFFSTCIILNVNDLQFNDLSDSFPFPPISSSFLIEGDFRLEVLHCLEGVYENQV